MAQYSTGDLKPGFKIEVDGEPYNVVSNEFVKPGKGQPFNRVKVRNLKTTRVIEKTFKSGDKVAVADIEENKMRMLYKESDGVVFMDEKTFDQITIPLALIGDNEQWLMEEVLYDIMFYKGEPIDLQPPTFMEMKITETAPGVRGDSWSSKDRCRQPRTCWPREDQRTHSDRFDESRLRHARVGTETGDPGSRIDRVAHRVVQDPR